MKNLKMIVLLQGFLASQLWASTYSDSQRLTVVHIDEAADDSTATRGYYTTRFAGQDVYGFITINSSEGAAGSYYYRGQFQDRTYGSASVLECSGDILLRRHMLSGRSTRLGLEVTWKALKGQGCGAVLGQSFVLNLEEAIPTPNAEGEYNAVKSNTMRSETNGDVTWPVWAVISSDHQLNCRKEPAGPIVHVYSIDEPILAETRGANAFVNKVHGSWMLTRRACYVRANQAFIEPVSVPELHRP